MEQQNMIISTWPILVQRISTCSRSFVIAMVGLLIIAVIALNSTWYSFFHGENGSSIYSDHDSQQHICPTKGHAILVQIHDDKEAKCMDGSAPSYYIRRGKVDKWHVHFEGGGWCYTLPHCLLRMKTKVGSSLEYEKCMSSSDPGLGFYNSNNGSENPLMHEWNMVFVKYCDGSSYAGDNVVLFENRTIYFKGKANRDATINHLLNTGLLNASEVVISGCSAGGLGVYLGIDDMRARIKAANPAIKVAAMSDSGFFMDHRSNNKWRLRGHLRIIDEAIVSNVMDYSTTMKRVYAMANMSAGANKACVVAETNRHRTPFKRSGGRSYLFTPSETCVFAQNLVAHIRTPIFAVQPKYDQWQIWHVIGNPENHMVVNAMGANITRLIETRLLQYPLSSSPRTRRNGAFIDSCAHHCQSCSVRSEDSWNGPRVRSNNIRRDRVTASEAFGKWYQSIVGSTNNETSAVNSLAHYYSQDKPYPCSDCCLCSARN